MSYWDNPPQFWGVSQVKTNLGHAIVLNGVGECLGKGCSDNREMQVLPVSAFVKGELHLVMDAIFS